MNRHTQPVAHPAMFTLLALTCLWQSQALANPRPLPFTYAYPTLPAGKFEFEQYVDLVPVRVSKELPDGSAQGVMSLRSVLQTELEYGITDRLELGWYFVFRQGASAESPFLRFDGIKQRLRYRLAEEGEWPINVGLYLEVAEFHNEIEVEEKILLSRRFGRLNLIANLWVEQEYYFQTGETKFIYNPTVGATFELSPHFTVGAEYWARGRFDSKRGPTDLDGSSDAPTATRHYVGPTLLVQSGEYWLSAGAYVRLDGLSSGNTEIGEPYGRVWVRAIIGIGF